MTSNVQKQLDRIQKSLDSGAYYEAQQMYKTVYHRNKAKKLLDESYQILMEGSRQQLLHKQVTCGSELALLLLEAYSADAVPATPERIQDVEAIITAFQASDSTDTAGIALSLDELDRVVSAAVSWGQQQSNTDGSRQLQDVAGHHIWKLYGWKQLGRASFHLARGRDAPGYAGILLEVSKLLPAKEVDYLVARAVLGTLGAATSATKAIQESQAHVLFEACRKQGIVSSHPIANFTKFVLIALDSEKEELFNLVRQKYQPSWSKDMMLEACLMKIRMVYFNTGNGGGISSLLQDLMASLQDDE